MSIPSLLTFILPTLTGTLIVHLLWADRKSPLDLILQLSLGTGLGLGISSLSYYIHLIFFSGNSCFIYMEVAVFLAVLAAVCLKHKTTAYVFSTRLNISFLQIAILAIAGVISAMSFIGIMDYSQQRAHGDWDAWMIYNRAARFIFRSGEHWQDAFSHDMNLVFHADYPQLLALHTASRWDILNTETTYVPMFLGFLFTLSTFGVIFGALANFKSVGQGSLGLIFLGGVSFFLTESGRQTADAPLALYILSSIVFLFFHYREKRAIFMTFAAAMAGLAAWTKNEGMLFLLASMGILFLHSLWKRSFQGFRYYLAGALLPLILLLHFKTQVSPPSEFVEGGLGVIIQKLTDPSRHQLIFTSFKNYFLYKGGWYGIGIFPILGGYFLLFRSRVNQNLDAIMVSLAILTAQFIGYYLFYLISPYDLNWHISFSINRLFVHVYPAIVFLALSTTQTPEVTFSSSLE